MHGIGVVQQHWLSGIEYREATLTKWKTLKWPVDSEISCAPERVLSV